MTTAQKAELKRLTGTSTDHALMDSLQLEHGLISDLCVNCEDVPDSDATRAIDALKDL